VDLLYKRRERLGVERTTWKVIRDTIRPGIRSMDDSITLVSGGSYLVRDYKRININVLSVGR
jgi:hypothetical protein